MVTASPSEDETSALPGPGDWKVGLTSSDGPDEGHEEEVDGVVPWRYDEHHPVRVLADEGGVQLHHL